MKVFWKQGLAHTGVALVACLLLASCAGSDEDEYPVLCAAEKSSNLRVQFSPPLDTGVYSLSLETPEGVTVCENTIGSDGRNSHEEPCSGDLDFGFHSTGFGVYATPTQVEVRLEHLDSGTVTEASLTPEYEEQSDYPEICPFPLAEMTIEPSESSTGQTQ